MIVWSDVLIAVPSFRRPGIVRVFNSFPDAVLFVPASQVAQYRRCYPKAQIREVPDAVDGDRARKDQWILANAGSQNVLVIDDDVEGVGFWEKNVETVMTPAAIHLMICRGFEMARAVGAPIWGINIIRDRRAYSVMRPFSFLSPILGPWCGHCLPHALIFDSAMGAKFDFDFFLQAIHRYRRVWRMNKYHYIMAEEVRGGWSTFRTAEREKQWAEAIMRKWGRRVIKYDEETKSILDGRVSIPIPGC